jgi:beta-N-acetylhexosaminidase
MRLSLASRHLLPTLLAVVVAGIGAAQVRASREAVEADRDSLASLIGQRLVVAMYGTSPSLTLLARVKAGEIGGVILFGGNVRNAPQVRALTAALHAAAREGGRPPLLIVADQEGGRTRRFAWLPPAPSAEELGRLSLARVRRIGEQTGRALRRLGIDVDLAPVADVPSVRDAFIAEQQRVYAGDPAQAAARARAFAVGLERADVAATAKHFPGLGRSATNTDLAGVAIDATRAELEVDLLPFRRLIAGGVPLVMVSNAVYSALGPAPAAWSTAVQSLLRRELGFQGVTITDALEPVARARGRSLEASAVLSARAGVDLLLVAGSEESSATVYASLLAAARAGRIPRASLERSYERILGLKERYGR